MQKNINMKKILRFIVKNDMDTIQLEVHTNYGELIKEPYLW
jgi:hypothetical protein